MHSYGPPHMAKQKQDDQLEHTYSSYVRIRDVALKTCQKRWMIGRGGERGSGISVLVARHDDDDDEFLWRHSFVKIPELGKTHLTSSYIYIYIYTYIFTNILSTSIHGYQKIKPPGTRDKNISNHRPGEKRKNTIGQKNKNKRKGQLPHTSWKKSRDML